ncbi:hypothetical protein ILYODFUR_034483 [Ilyodon furcidens]|uniref:Uncharacterized protein n=1 Tax=Ilyodon furcidens TaxID=33524 RepID=A0ABV0TP91_9TELE
MVPGRTLRRSEPQTSKGPPKHRNPRRTTAGTTATPENHKYTSGQRLQPPAGPGAGIPGATSPRTQEVVPFLPGAETGSFGFIQIIKSYVLGRTD